MIARRYIKCRMKDVSTSNCSDDLLTSLDEALMSRAEMMPPSHGTCDNICAEFCRGEVVLPGDATRHWTEDETDLFTGGDLMYCGGCCGQHLASDACNVQFSIETNYDGRDGVCDRWISCFVDQCRVRRPRNTRDSFL